MDIQGDGLRATGKIYYKKLILDCCVTYFEEMGVLELRISRQVAENTKFVVAKETRDYFRITDIQSSNKLVFEKEFWIKELSLKSMLPFIASWFKTMLQNIISVKLVNHPHLT